MRGSRPTRNGPVAHGGREPVRRMVAVARSGGSLARALIRKTRALLRQEPVVADPDTGLGHHRPDPLPPGKVVWRLLVRLGPGFVEVPLDDDEARRLRSGAQDVEAHVARLADRALVVRARR